jgi:integration host factor subunit beta
MTKATLLERIADSYAHRSSIPLTPLQIQEYAETLFEGIRVALSEGDKVEIRGFGSFRLRQRKVRQGRNPKTGEKVRVPEKVVPFFKPGVELREMVDQ